MSALRSSPQPLSEGHFLLAHSATVASILLPCRPAGSNFALLLLRLPPPLLPRPLVAAHSVVEMMSVDFSSMVDDEFLEKLGLDKGTGRAKLRRANVRFLSAPVSDGTTGTVIVLTTPDAQRTMLVYQGTSSTVNYDAALSGIVSKTNVLAVEGYLFELPDTIKTIKKACEEAHRNGALVAITASDVSCIEKHYDDFWEVIGEYADIVLGNSDEARALCDFNPEESPVAATRYLSHLVPLISVTDGPKGSYFGVKGEAIYIPPSPCIPIDTCGAGDAYASGVLYGMLGGVSDLKGIGSLVARVASTVVRQQGTRLRAQDAIGLAESFAYLPKNCPAIGTDQLSGLQSITITHSKVLIP
ncbi:hypothetical protein SAY87_012205 [Trapa incisa]|uniref:Carbohydrate kinase PfkB domain-containing protein n=1 Tax=Trapa incisa TaxID=236973 RepID=A0AAN7GS18_9MYRT|nr:hypothetical protein SAY87_012205 [Trapa incisa]